MRNFYVFSQTKTRTTFPVFDLFYLQQKVEENLGSWEDFYGGLVMILFLWPWPNSPLHVLTPMVLRCEGNKFLQNQPTWKIASRLPTDVKPIKEINDSGEHFAKCVKNSPHNHHHTPQDDLSELALMCNQGMAGWGFLLHSKAIFCTKIMFGLSQPHHDWSFIETTQSSSTPFTENFLCPCGLSRNSWPNITQQKVQF